MAKKAPRYWLINALETPIFDKLPTKVGSNFNCQKSCAGNGGFTSKWNKPVVDWLQLITHEIKPHNVQAEFQTFIHLVRPGGMWILLLIDGLASGTKIIQL